MLQQQTSGSMKQMQQMQMQQSTQVRAVCLLQCICYECVMRSVSKNDYQRAWAIDSLLDSILQSMNSLQQQAQANLRGRTASIGSIGQSPTPPQSPQVRVWTIDRHENKELLCIDDR